MLDLTRLSSAIKAETKEEKLYVKYCREIGLKPEDLHKTFKSVRTNQTYEIIGLTKRGRLIFVQGLLMPDGIISMPFDIQKIKNSKYYLFEEN